MRRHTTSRILLSLLLMWQLGTGAFTQAHGMMGRTAQSLATDGAGRQADASQGHCAKHGLLASSGATAGMDGMSMQQNAVPPHHGTQPDCCQSSMCKCPCMQACAVSTSLPFVAAVIPDSLHILIADAPLLHASVSGLFRPPI